MKGPRKRPTRSASPRSEMAHGYAKSRYAVGYGRPPKKSQFKRGVSGNPRGRPKGRKNLRTRMADILNSKIVKRDGDKRQIITVMEGMLLKQVENALKGSERAFMSAFKIGAALGLFEKAGGAGEDTPLSQAEQALVAEILARVPGSEVEG